MDIIKYYKKNGLFKSLKKLYYFSIIKSGILKAYLKYKNRSFIYNSKEYKYYYQDYNATYTNERSVEIPIFKELIEQSNTKKILEIGNVMSHYFDINHKVVDKFERSSPSGYQICNQDVVDLDENDKYDLIISISTIEHVGYDDDNVDPTKIITAINKLKNMLKDEGQLIISFPLGYNKYLDNFYKELGFDYTYFKRLTYSEWEQVDNIDDDYDNWGSTYPGANVLVIGKYQKFSTP
jgi:hypothetical protein